MSIDNVTEAPRAAGLRWRGLSSVERRDLLILAVLALLTPLLAVAPDWPALALARVPLGLASVLMAPGYALATALFPHRGDLDLPAQAGLSFGLSIALLPLMALILDALPWGIRPLPMALSLSALIGLCASLVALRRAMAPAEPTAPPPQLPLRRIAGPLLIVLLLIALALLSLGVTRSGGSNLTEFYALGADGLAESYPRTVAPGEPMRVTLGVTNHEGRTMRYRVEARAGAELLAATAPFTLEPDATWQQPFPYALPHAGADQMIELLLFVEGQAAPYRRLQLWVDVAAAG